MNDDDRLSEAFQATRVSELADTPSFRRVLAGRVRRHRQRLVPKLLTLGAVLVVLIIAVRSLGRPDPDLELARQVMAWPGTTDFLLPASAPGFLSTVPRIAEAVPGSPLQALDPGGVLGPPLLPRSPL